MQLGLVAGQSTVSLFNFCLFADRWQAGHWTGLRHKPQFQAETANRRLVHPCTLPPRRAQAVTGRWPKVKSFTIVSGAGAYQPRFPNHVSEGRGGCGRSIQPPSYIF